MNIYLAGYISDTKLKECIAWRKEIREHYDNWKGGRYPIEWLDPLNGEVFGTISDSGLKCSIEGKALIYRDYKSVKISDLIIANLELIGERPLTGTIFELAWAWEHKIPVIVITTKQIYKEHPFIKDTATIIVSSVKEMLDKKLINYFFKGMVSAEY